MLRDNHEQWLRILQMLGWAYLLVPLAGIIICAVYRRLSSRMGIVLAGFAGVLGASVARMCFQYLMQTWLNGERDRFWMTLAGFNLASLVSWGLVLCGLATVFADLWRQLEDGQPRGGRGLLPELTLADTERAEVWRRKREGSDDIQT
jgi:uncharacterized membrane protein YeaQ/YmgE (transglycosylase-associated protein family)